MFQLPWSNLKNSPHEKIPIPPLQKQLKINPPWKISTFLKNYYPLPPPEKIHH